MKTYGEPKDPNELKDYECDWSDKLGEGETVVSQVVSFVDAAGTTNPTNSISSPYSRVWLAGGTSGQRAVYTILITTSGGRTLEASFGVNILDSAAVPTDLENLQADLVAVKDAIRRLMAGEFVKDVSRDGRRIVSENPTYRNLLDHRDLLKREIQGLQNVEQGLPRRSAIGTFYC